MNDFTKSQLQRLLQCLIEAGGNDFNLHDKLIWMIDNYE